MKNKYYAIGMKTWAEIREASKQPKACPSTVQREAEIQDFQVFIDTLGRSQMRPRKRTVKFNLAQTTYAGGKVVCSISLRRLRGYGVPLADGGIVELPPDIAESILKRAGGVGQNLSTI